MNKQEFKAAWSQYRKDHCLNGGKVAECFWNREHAKDVEAAIKRRRETNSYLDDLREQLEFQKLYYVA